MKVEPNRVGHVSHVLTCSVGGTPEPLALLLTADVRNPAVAVSVSLAPPTPCRSHNVEQVSSRDSNGANPDNTVQMGPCSAMANPRPTTWAIAPDITSMGSCASACYVELSESSSVVRSPHPRGCTNACTEQERCKDACVSEEHAPSSDLDDRLSGHRVSASHTQGDHDGHQSDRPMVDCLSVEHVLDSALETEEPPRGASGASEGPELSLDFGEWGVLGVPSHGYVTVHNLGPLMRRVTTWGDAQPPPGPPDFAHHDRDPRNQRAHANPLCPCPNPYPPPLNGPVSCNDTRHTAEMTGPRSSVEAPHFSRNAHGSHVTGRDAHRSSPPGKGRASIVDTCAVRPCSGQMSNPPDASQSYAAECPSLKPRDAKRPLPSQPDATMHGTGGSPGFPRGTSRTAGEALSQQREVRSPGTYLTQSRAHMSPRRPAPAAAANHCDTQISRHK